MIRHHLLVMIRQAWAQLAGDADTFADLFVGSGVADDILEQVRSELVPDDDVNFLRFQSVYNHNTPHFPQVVVHALDENSPRQTFGFSGEADEDGRRVYSLHLSELLSVYVYAQAALPVDVLHTAMRAIILSLAPWLLKVRAASHIEYRGSTGVEPLPDLFPEATGVFVRRQSWAFSGMAHVRESTAQTLRDIVVAAWDITIDGQAGGITIV